MSSVEKTWGRLRPHEQQRKGNSTTCDINRNPLRDGEGKSRLITVIPSRNVTVFHVDATLPKPMTATVENKTVLSVFQLFAKIGNSGFSTSVIVNGEQVNLTTDFVFYSFHISATPI